MPRQAWTVILLFVLPTVAEMTDVVPLHPAFFIKMGVSQTFLLGRPGTVIFPISASHVAWDDRHVSQMSNWNHNLKKKLFVGYWWLTPVILATLEAEIRRITL
jgi:hypothetical protein